MIGLDETPTVTPSPVNMFPLAECLFLPQTMNPPVSTSNASDSTDAATINGQINSNGVLHQIVPDPLVLKTALVSPDEETFEALRVRLDTQLKAGQGETVFEVGVGVSKDPSAGNEPGLLGEELEASIATLRSLAVACDADCRELRRRATEGGKEVAQFLIRKHMDDLDFMEVRVAVVGNVDAGKSTLLGVLTHGVLDNGRGLARLKLFRHKHEADSGRTSSVGNDILGFDAAGNVVNECDSHGGIQDWTAICQKAAKVITFIDLAGHEKYLKTTIFGMTGHAPDFCMLMVGANAGVVGMCKEHLGLALALSVPVFVVVTKIDMCPPNVLANTLKLIQKILRSPGCRKLPILVQTEDDVAMTATNFTTERICPIFQVSNVTGENLDLLRHFLNLLTTRVTYDENDAAEFQIDDTYTVPGVGTVVSGTALKGTISLNDTLLLGPDPLGHFQPLSVKSIHRKRLPVSEVRGGQSASFALKKQVKRTAIRKGMVLVSPNIQPKACWEFEGELLVLHHPTTISANYQAMLHCGSIRQTASIITMSVDHMRTGDKATVRFRFLKNPEYLHEGQRLVFREGRTKAIGSVVKLLPEVKGTPLHTSKRKHHTRKYASGATGSARGTGSAEASDSSTQVSAKRGTGRRKRAGKSGVAANYANVAEGGAITELAGQTDGDSAEASSSEPSIPNPMET